MTNVVKRWEKYLNRDSAAGEGRLTLPHHDLYMNKNYSSVKICIEFFKILIKYKCKILTVLHTTSFIQRRGHLTTALSLAKKKK